MKHYILGFLSGLILAGGVATAQLLSPWEIHQMQERQSQQYQLEQFRQQELMNQNRQNMIQQNMLNEMRRHSPC